MAAERVVAEKEKADQVWDGTATEHVAAGSMGKLLADINAYMDGHKQKVMMVK